MSFPRVRGKVIVWAREKIDGSREMELEDLRSLIVGVEGLFGLRVMR